jgi:toxin-antitoxin system PIN domain toxin
VKLVDVNVLIYATDDQSKRHPEAKPWLDGVMTATETIGLPTAVTIGYLRLTTNPRVMRVPLSPSEAIEIVRTWLSRPSVSVPQPTDRHLDLLDELLGATGVGGNLVSDAHLAALAIEHGAELWSYDADFGRFPGLLWRSPPT